MADLINTLSVGKPAVIGMDILFSEASNTPEQDADLEYCYFKV